jgi:hypothetical protein
MLGPELVEKRFDIFFHIGVSLVVNVRIFELIVVLYHLCLFWLGFNFGFLFSFFEPIQLVFLPPPLIPIFLVKLIKLLVKLHLPLPCFFLLPTFLPFQLLSVLQQHIPQNFIMLVVVVIHGHHIPKATGLVFFVIFVPLLSVESNLVVDIFDLIELRLSIFILLFSV